jgi:hypothetical protein
LACIIGSSCERSKAGIRGVGVCEGIVAAIADLGSLLGGLVDLFCRTILIYIMGNREDRSYIDIKMYKVI